ncbi:anaerobic benzoate catabolism transcriptional regulator [Sorangium cellulosum]|uniref:Shikimate kinase n=1 Tax=Sorangium cellulosum TaxID=56 RepID=A0A4P2PVS7_SORCE|nr:shikimate kinase [Sorangium cellulosum]AUX20573.1 anaerobic benzoate catabolism transcriptional regulator [Sorangium cellulosum]
MPPRARETPRQERAQPYLGQHADQRAEQRPGRSPGAGPGGVGGGATPILAHLAGRLRQRRTELALTLRELAQLAGVSERFLVQLEGGRANVSVARLEDIGRALGTSAAALLSTGELAAEAAPGRSPPGEAEAGAGAPLLALLGLRGAGKTTIGARAAARLGVPFLELDGLVSARAGMSLAALFEIHGNAYYRRLEREELARLEGARARGVVATGGGLVTDPATFELLRRAAVTVWLRAPPEDHWRRVVEQGDARPMANRTDAMKELRALFHARRALYEQADFVVDTSALGLARSVDRVVKIAREAGRRNATRSP